MNTPRDSIYYSWPLYVSVILLVLNDHILKQTYSGWLTGKLSDFSGIFLTVLYLRSIFPKRPVIITTSVVIMFTFWKSNLSQYMIDSINDVGYFYIGRVVDYTDLTAFLMIPIAHYVFENSQNFRIKFNFIEFLKIPVIIFTTLAITATSFLPPHQKYLIRKESEHQNIDRAKAVTIIKEIADQYNLACVKCELLQKNGKFKNEEIVLVYSFAENDRGVEFEVSGEPASSVFGGGSSSEMDNIQLDLLWEFKEKFRDIKLEVILKKYEPYNEKILNKANQH